MFPALLAIPAPIPLAFDLTVTLGPVLLIVLLALLDIGAVAALRAAIMSRRPAQPGAARAEQPSTRARQLRPAQRAS